MAVPAQVASPRYGQYRGWQPPPVIVSADGLIDVYHMKGLQVLSAGATYEEAFEAEFQVIANNWDLARSWPGGSLTPPRISRMGTASAWIIGRIENSPIMVIDEQRSDFVPQEQFHLFVQEILPKDMPDADLMMLELHEGRIEEDWPSLTSATLTEQVYEVLRDRILAGGWGAGHFIREQDVSNKLRVSRTPVREALGRLASEGFLERIPHRGFRLPEQTATDRLKRYPILASLEVLAAKYSFPRIGANELEELRSVNRAYAEATAKIDEMVRRLSQPLELPPELQANGTRKLVSGSIESNFTPEQYAKVIDRCIEYIYAGDVIQVTFAQRFSRRTEAHPFQIYRALRGINPSPYMYYLNLDGFQIVGAAIETVVTVHDGVAATHPIAGTRPRGATP
ncbi:MAG: chorismate-binding protein, partial [Acidobacteria bacterium]|nr:chorismate-binding protein [Acidobacteriota bacterium]